MRPQPRYWNLQKFVSLSIFTWWCTDLRYGCYTTDLRYGCYTTNLRYGCYTTDLRYGCYTTDLRYGCYTTNLRYGCYTTNLRYGCYTKEKYCLDKGEVLKDGWTSTKNSSLMTVSWCINAWTTVLMSIYRKGSRNVLRFIVDLQETVTTWT